MQTMNTFHRAIVHGVDAPTVKFPVILMIANKFQKSVNVERHWKIKIWIK